MKLEHTRKIIDAIHDGSLLQASYEETPVFGLRIPDSVNGVPSKILRPENMVGDQILGF
jgi:phosphoenolpyruvate carboxykinase (ATP)